MRDATVDLAVGGAIEAGDRAAERWLVLRLDTQLRLHQVDLAPDLEADPENDPAAEEQAGDSRHAPGPLGDLHLAFELDLECRLRGQRDLDLKRRHSVENDPRAG